MKTGIFLDIYIIKALSFQLVEPSHDSSFESIVSNYSSSLVLVARAVLLYHVSKKVPDQFGESEKPLKALSDTKLILNNQESHSYSFRTFRGPLFPKPVTGQVLFLDALYSKTALTTDSKRAS